MLKVYLGARTTTDVSDSGGGTASPFDRRAVAKARSAATTSASRTKRRTRIPAIVALDALFRRFLQQLVECGLHVRNVDGVRVSGQIDALRILL